MTPHAIAVAVSWLNSGGLLLNILGVVMIWFYGFPQPSFSKAGALLLEDNNPTPDGRTYRRVRAEQAATMKTYLSLSTLALFWMIAGFVLQFLAALMNGTYS